MDPTIEDVEPGSTEEFKEKLFGTENRKPLLLYIVSTDKKVRKTAEALAATTWKDERVALGAKFFRLVQVYQTEIGPNHPLRKLSSGRKLPRAVLMSMDGKTVKKLEGKFSATRLFGAMSSIVRRDFKRSLGTFVSRMRKLLNSLDALSNDRRKLDYRKAVALEKGRTGKLKALKKKEQALDAKKQALVKKMELLLSWTTSLGGKTAKAR